MAPAPNRRPISSDDLVHFPGIQPARQRGGTYEIAEHHREPGVGRRSLVGQAGAVVFELAQRCQVRGSRSIFPRSASTTPRSRFWPVRSRRTKRSMRFSWPDRVSSRVGERLFPYVYDGTWGRPGSPFCIRHDLRPPPRIKGQPTRQCNRGESHENHQFDGIDELGSEREHLFAQRGSCLNPESKETYHEQVHRPDTF
jgi:hypothetical protein